MKVSAVHRLQIIQDLLQKHGEVSSSQLSERFKVSMETIRKDLETLEANGVARKMYGGAVLDQTGAEKQMDLRTENRDLKQQIGKQAARLLEGAQSVFLDAGSTVLAAVPFINRMPSMNIMTNSLDAFEALDGNLHNVFLCGGKKRPKNRSLVGSFAEQMVRSFHCDVALMGTAGIAGSRGPTCHSYQEISLKKAVSENSDRIYVLADPSKFRQNGLYVWESWEAVDGVVVSPGLSCTLADSLGGAVSVFENVREEL